LKQNERMSLSLKISVRLIKMLLRQTAIMPVKCTAVICSHPFLCKVNQVKVILSLVNTCFREKSIF